MDFEFDSNKSEANKLKHGIDFHEAQALWKDENYLELPAKSGFEFRSLVIGMIGSKLWTAIVTYRDENTRIISVRRAREDERNFYES